jgi:hypothetical protein
MLGNILTRRAALLSFGAFASAGLSGCNTTPSAGIQPAAAPSGLNFGAVNVDTRGDRPGPGIRRAWRTAA